MSSLVSPEYLLVVAILAISFQFLKEGFARNLLVGMAGLSTLYLIDAGSVIVCALSLVLNYLWVTCIFHYRKWIILSFAISANCIYLYLARQYLGTASIGVSFYSFTCMVFIIDFFQSEVRRPSFDDFFAFVTNPFTVTMGPILHTGNMRHPLLDFRCSPEYRSSFISVTLGLVSKVVISSAIYEAYIHTEVRDSLLSPILKGFSYYLYLYFDFVGYVLIVSGLAKMCGYRLPENFNFPNLSNNVQEFWRRWHISLSSVIRFYLFDSIYRLLKYRLKLDRKSVWIRVLPAVSTMLIVGVWHGNTLNFLLFGLLHGMATVMNQIYTFKNLNSVFSRIFTHIFLSSTFLVFQDPNITSLFNDIRFSIESGVLIRVPSSPSFSRVDALIASFGVLIYFFSTPRTYEILVNRAFDWCFGVVAFVMVFVVASGGVKTFVYNGF